MELLKYSNVRLGKYLSALYYRGGHLQWNPEEDDTELDESSLWTQAQ